jgi:FkbM family methyltransferase
MTGWGSVIAIEPQERIYYALAGNIAINNCFNAVAMYAAVSSAPGVIRVPSPDYLTPSSFGSLELKPRADTEFIGQAIDYSDDKTIAVQQISLDAMARPIVLVVSIKAGPMPLRAWLEERGYRVVDAGMNLLAIHRSDPTLNELQIPETPVQPSAA